MDPLKSPQKKKVASILPPKTYGKHGTRTITEQDSANAHSQKEQNETKKNKKGK